MLIYTGAGLTFMSLELMSLLVHNLGTNRCKWLGILEFLTSFKFAPLDNFSVGGFKFSSIFGTARWIHSNSISRVSNCLPKCETVTPSKPINRQVKISSRKLDLCFFLSYREILPINPNPAPTDNYKSLHRIWFECMSNPNLPLSLQYVVSPSVLYKIWMLTSNTT